MSGSIKELIALCSELQQQVVRQGQANDQANIQTINQILIKIQQFPINLSMLKESKAGVTLNRIKKDLLSNQSNTPAINLIKIIIKQWKDLAINQSIVQSIVQSTSNLESDQSTSQPIDISRSKSPTTSRSDVSSHRFSSKQPDNGLADDLISTASRRKRPRNELSDDDQSNKQSKNRSTQLSPSSAPAYTMSDLPTSYQSTSDPSDDTSNSQPHHESLDNDLCSSDQPVDQSTAQPPPLPVINPNTFVFRQSNQNAVNMVSDDEDQSNVESNNLSEGDVVDESFDPTSKSRHKRSLDIDLIDESIPLSGGQTYNGPVRICSLAQMCTDHLVINLSKIHQFTMLPSSMIGQILYKGLINLPIHQSINQLVKFERGCPQLDSADTEALWKVLVMKKFLLNDQEMQQALNQLHSQSSKPSSVSNSALNKPTTSNHSKPISNTRTQSTSSSNKSSLDQTKQPVVKVSDAQRKPAGGKPSAIGSMNLPVSRSASDANKSPSSSIAPCPPSYRRLFSHLELQKESKLATLGSRLKQRAETEKKERSDTKMMSVNHAISGMKQIKSVQNLINKSTAANSPPSTSSSQASRASANRMNSLRKQTKSVAKSVWSKAKAVGRK